MAENPSHSSIPSLRLNRRRLVQGAAVGLAAALPARMLSASDRMAAWNLWQQENPGAAPDTVDEYVPIVLSATEWATLTAVVNRLFPKTDATPGGAETGAHIFIDRTLSTVYTANIPDYRAGLAAIEKSVDGGFAAADPDTQDATLTELEAGKLTGAPDRFFGTLLGHTRQGMFCDPIYGGNRQFMGWDMIGYPGIKLVWSEGEQAIDAMVKPEHISVQKYGGQAR